MVRRSLFLPALAAVSGLLMAGWTAPASAAAPAPAAAPASASDHTPALKLTLHTLSPSYLPAEGPVRVTASVTNADDVPWVGINIYGFLGTEPMVSQSELAGAAESDPLSLVGDRIIEEGSYHTVDELEPGEEARFSLTIDRALLQPTSPGVYWFGLQALGESIDQPSDLISDGRARTFLPYLPPSVPGQVKTALVLPLRHYLPYSDDGSLAGLKHWARTLSIGGRLRDLVEFANSSGNTPVTWLVDPAVPDAIARLSMDNPPRTLAPTEPPPDEEPGESPSGSPSESADPDAGPDALEPSPQTRAAAEAAGAWLRNFEEAVQGDQILALPYGDLDVAAAAELDPDLYEIARERPSRVLTDWGETTEKGVAAPSGFLNEAGFEMVSDDTTVLATDRMFGGDAPGVARIDGKKVAVMSSGAAGGGPGPGERFSSVQLRQRILSEAAVRLLSPGRHPLVVALPLEWQPGDDDRAFFTGLDADWLDLTTVADAIDRDGTLADPADLAYPVLQQRRQLDEPTFAEVRGLIAAGETLQNLLTLNSGVSDSITEQALAGASYGSRETPIPARSALIGARTFVEDQLRSVKISAGPGVTLSGRDGGFATVITNGLDQPVTVNVVARSDGGVEIEPIEQIELAADSRSTVVLDAHANRVGVTNVTLRLTDVEGNPLGSSDRLPVRSAQVSVAIWLIIGTGLGLLFLAILVRLFRRIRRSAVVPPPPTVESS